MKFLKNIAIIQKIATAVVLFAVCAPSLAHAEAPKDMQVSPAVIDEKAKQRDIIKESITLTNIGSRPLNLFPAVEDVNVQNGDQSFAYAQNAYDRGDSLANWIELSRGVISLQPGETKTVPFVIRVNMNAAPGVYHVAITFTDGMTRDATEQKNPDGVAEVNVEVAKDIKEDLQLVKFTTDRVAFNGDDVLFNYQLMNNGNQDLLPTGDIRIYDRRGEEVASVDVNRQGKTISPQQNAQLASIWNAVQGFGQYKAIITVNYGAQAASVQDTIFFWIVPWKQMLGLFTATMIAIAILGVYFHRMFEEKHLNKLAMAGVLKTHPITAAALADVVKYVPHMSPAPASPPKRPPPKIEAPKEQKEPKDRLVVKVAENAVVAWRLFSTFKQRGRITPQDIAQERAATQPQKVVQSSASAGLSRRDTLQVRSSERETHYYREQQHEGTIDLKKMRAQSAQPSHELHEGHVVNLKKNI